MSDAFVARANNFFVGPQGQLSGEDQSKTNPVAAAVTNLSLTQRTFDVKESLEWLLGPEEEHLHTEEKSAIRERRFDLLLWLLNLEPRLGHYGGDPQSA
ncbi:MAG TPA: hypothetical protein V6C76_03935 [Drouetiella sp.]